MRRLFPILLAIGALGSGTADAAELRAGVATADITPENGGTTLGFVRPDVMVKGVHTRLMGRALVLDDGDTEVALLATASRFALQKDSLVARVKDLGSATRRSSTRARTRTRARRTSPTGRSSSSRRAIRKAHAARVPARAGVGPQRVLDVNRNRSIEAHLANHGLDQFYGQGHAEDDPRGVEHSRDTRLRLLRVDRLDGRPLAGWIHFPVHLTTSGPEVDIWDTDLAGAATHHLEQAVGANGFVGPLYERHARAT